MEGADPAKTAALCLFHDTQETRIGDVPSVGKAYVVTAPNPEVTADQVAGFPAEIGQAVRELVEEYESSREPGGPAGQGCRQAGVPDPGPRVPGPRPRGRAALDRDLGGRACSPSRLASSPRPASRCRRGSGGRPLRSRIRGRSRRVQNRYVRPETRPIVLNQADQSRRKRAGPDVTCSLDVSLPLQAASGRPSAALDRRPNPNQWLFA